MTSEAVREGGSCFKGYYYVGLVVTGLPYVIQGMVVFIRFMNALNEEETVSTKKTA